MRMKAIKQYFYFVLFSFEIQYSVMLPQSFPTYSSTLRVSFEFDVAPRHVAVL